MRKFFVGAALAALGVVSVAGWKTIRPAAEAWEYKHVIVTIVSSDSTSDAAGKYETLQSELAALGKDGWELVTISDDIAPEMSGDEYEMNTIHRFFLKRLASK